jgi:hypothetical protein
VSNWCGRSRPDGEEGFSLAPELLEQLQSVGFEALKKRKRNYFLYKSNTIQKNKESFDKFMTERKRKESKERKKQNMAKTGQDGWDNCWDAPVGSSAFESESLGLALQ